MPSAAVFRVARWSAATLVLALVVTGCAPEREPIGMPSAPITAEPATPTPKPQAEATDFAPLTGVKVPVGSLPGPSLAAKIDNHDFARPQEGLERTDIVFEELVEGGLTRYVAVWHSDVPDTIGPVRSIRPMDPYIVSPLGGIIAFSGGQYRFLVAMKDTPVYNAIHGQRDTEDTFYRARDRPSPHDVLVRAPQVVAQHAALAPPQPQFAYAIDDVWSSALERGEKAVSASLAFSGQSQRGWVWSEGRRRWMRSMDGAAHVDSHGGQLTATNVVVVRVRVVNDGGVPRTELLGTGEAWVMTEGRTLHGTWSKPSKTDVITLTDDSGEPILLLPGNTWVELVPVTGSVEFVRPVPPTIPTPLPTPPGPLH